MGAGTGTEPAAVHQYRRRDSLEQTRREPAGGGSFMQPDSGAAGIMLK